MFKDTHNQNENNQLCIAGEIASTPTLEYSIYGEKFYSMKLNSKRLSDIIDTVKVIFSDRLIKLPENPENMIGQLIEIHGQFRSYNKHIEETHKNLLELNVFAKEIIVVEEDTTHKNEILLRGFICKNPVHRKTPLGRKITDVLLGVNRPYGKSDYIPCIFWERNAIFAKELSIGTELVVKGRIQSRPYTKKHEDGTMESKIAYEVSVSNVCLPSDLDEEIKEDHENLCENTEE